MKIDLIGMILNHAGREPFRGIIVDDDGRELDAERSLDAMIMDHAIVRGGGQSTIVAVNDAIAAAPRMARSRALDINGRLANAYLVAEGITPDAPMPDLSDVSLADAIAATRIVTADPVIEVKPDGTKVLTCVVAERAVARTLASAIAAQAAR